VAEAPQKKKTLQKKTRGITTVLNSNTMPALANDTFDLPLAKRQKTVLEEKSRGSSRGGSKIFAPFRVRLGLRQS
jgi:hypothetical protein